MCDRHLSGYPLPLTRARAYALTHYARPTRSFFIPLLLFFSFLSLWCKQNETLTNALNILNNHKSERLTYLRLKNAHAVWVCEQMLNVSICVNQWEKYVLSSPCVIDVMRLSLFVKIVNIGVQRLRTALYAERPHSE